MNSSQDRHIGTLWAEHFPKHHTDPASRSICLTVLHIVQNKAQLSLPLAGTVHKLNHVLATFGIPENEFQEMNGICKDPLQAQIILRLFSSRSKTHWSESVKPESRGPMLLGPVTTVKVNNHAYDPSPMIRFKWMEGAKRPNAIIQVRRKIPENEARIRDIEPDTHTDQRARYAKHR
jgi:hypothetical protein